MSRICYYLLAGKMVKFRPLTKPIRLQDSFYLARSRAQKKLYTFNDCSRGKHLFCFPRIPMFSLFAGTHVRTVTTGGKTARARTSWRKSRVKYYIPVAYRTLNDCSRGKHLFYFPRILMFRFEGNKTDVSRGSSH